MDYEQEILQALQGLHAFQDEDRYAAYDRLVAIPEADALATLTAMLGSPDPNVRGDAALGLLQLDTTKTLPLVLPLLQDPDSALKYYACGLLHDFGDARVTDSLCRLIRLDPSGNVRYMACWTLSAHGDKRALPDLNWVFENDNGTDYEGRIIRDMAAEAIQEITKRDR